MVNKCRRQGPHFVHVFLDECQLGGNNKDNASDIWDASGMGKVPSLIRGQNFPKAVALEDHTGPESTQHNINATTPKLLQEKNQFSNTKTLTTLSPESPDSWLKTMR
jgi:hypothetical protein